VGEGVLDSRIGDLETLSNPTVGLTAHSGIVTIRIVAKAGTNAQANELITRIEMDLRDRLGDDIFGSDDDTLEGIALSIAQIRGWRLSTLEYQTGGALVSRLERIGNRTFIDGEILEFGPENLVERLKQNLLDNSTSVALGLACSQNLNEQKATIALVTQDQCEERILSYGGHPSNLVRWSVNHALDLLRRVAIKAK
jgi:nicotinamide-nucleotide amidase